MNIKPLKYKLTILVLVGIVAIVYASLFATPSFADIQKSVIPTASLYQSPKQVAKELKFIDDNNNSISLDTTIGDKWTMMYFGYTSCPDVCPIDMAVLGRAYSTMKHKDELQVLFVSIDPARDIGVMNTYAQNFNTTFKGVTLKDEDLKTLTKKLGVYSEVVKRQEEAYSDHSNHAHHNHKEEKSKHYLINHTATFLLLNPDKELTALFSSPHIMENTAKALDRIIAYL